MNRPPSAIPAFITMMAACLFCVLAVAVRVAAQAADPIAISQTAFAWVMVAAGTITLLIGIGYGFAKKQKYANLEQERDELKSIAESREIRIKELKEVCEATETRLKLKIANKETDIINLKESNGALVTQSLQMKGILRDLRLKGVWHGHEDNIHDTHHD
jgi:hypothetical protein